MPLHSKTRGSGPPLVLIHGLFGSLENLGGIARLLSDEFTVHSIDLPNHGRSLHTDEASLHEMSDLVCQWMREHKLGSAFVVGHSLGGKVAMELALEHPEMVDQLVVIDISPVTYPRRHDDVFAGLNAFSPNKLTHRTEADKAMREHVKEPAVRSFLLKNLVVDENRGGFKWRMNLSAIESGYEGLISGNKDAHYDGRVLFLKGGDSDYIKEAHRAEVLKRFSNTEMRIVSKTGHWLHAEKPDVVSGVIKRFLQ